jgi:hypothetical protein
LTTGSDGGGGGPVLGVGVGGLQPARTIDNAQASKERFEQTLMIIFRN